MPLHQCIFSIRAIRFNKIYFRNFGHHLLKTFFLEHLRLEDIFLGAPYQDQVRKTKYLTYAFKKLVFY